MSEREWNHPVFEQMRNAEVNAPEHIMHAAIKKSNRRGFFFFDWRTLNVWYLAFGLGMVLTYWSWKSQADQSPNVAANASQQEQMVIKRKATKVSPAVLAHPAAKQNEQTEVLAGKRQHCSLPLDHQAQSAESISDAQVMPPSSTQMQNTTSDVQQASFAAADSVKVQSNPVVSFTQEKKASEQKRKGRSLKVKLGDSAKP
ncbi:MAG: hypothetical protein RLY35_182 [Bacteroidota bacterium]|jgi:hypothetical protein